MKFKVILAAMLCSVAVSTSDVTQRQRGTIKIKGVSSAENVSKKSGGNGDAIGSAESATVGIAVIDQSQRN